MDMYACSGDEVLEDEESYAGQLKEYLFSQKHLGLPASGSMSLCSEIWRRLLWAWLPTTGECANILVEGSDYQTLWLRNSRAERSQNKGAGINEGEQQLKSKSLEGRDYVRNGWANTIFKEQKDQDLPIGSPHHAYQHMQKGNPSLHQCQGMFQQDV
ncbi:rCG24653, partial [Rattus norvegicus]